MQVLNEFIKAVRVQFEGKTLHVFAECQCRLHQNFMDEKYRYDQNKYKNDLAKDLEESGFEKIHVHLKAPRSTQNPSWGDKSRMQWHCGWTPDWGFIEWSHEGD